MTEEQEAAIIRKVFVASYSHAEAVLHRLAKLQGRMSHDEAVAQLHAEVVEEEP